MYAARVRGYKKRCSLSSAKVQIFIVSDKSRSYVGGLSVICRSVNGVGVLLTPVNIGEFYTFLHFTI